MHPGTRGNRGPRQATRIAQRIQRAAAPVQHGAVIPVGTAHLGNRRARQKLDRRAEPLVLLGARAH